MSNMSFNTPLIGLLKIYGGFFNTPLIGLL